MSWLDYPVLPGNAERERRAGPRARDRPMDAQNAPICKAADQPGATPAAEPNAGNARVLPSPLVTQRNLGYRLRGCPVRRACRAPGSSLGGCRVSGLSSVRGCGLKSRLLQRRWLYGVAVIPRRSCAAMFSGQRVPGRLMGSRCWVSQFSRSSASRSRACSGGGSPRSGLSTCPPSAVWLIADSGGA